MFRKQLILAMVWCSVAYADVILDNNKYKGIVIALDPEQTVPDKSQQITIVENIKELMGKASSSVFEALDQRAYFDDITIVIPEDWTMDIDRAAIGRFESWKGSHFRVVSEGRHSMAPKTVQGGGCGVPGTRLEVPMDYLLDTKIQEQFGQSGLVMTSEWLKYRYGVFEEYGYPGDALYPHAYLDVKSNKTLPTGCTNQDGLVGKWIDRKGSSCDVTDGSQEVDAECRFAVEDSSVDYSLMYISHLEKVNHLCTKDTHDPLPPTPQNRFCNGKSIWEVILQHDDFTEGKNPPDTSSPDTTPKFTIVQPVQPALYLLIDESCGQNPSGGDECLCLEVYDKLRETLKDVLKSNTPRIGLRKYISEYSALFKKEALIPTNEIDETAFLEFLPMVESFIQDNYTNSESALVKALTEISASDYKGPVSLLFIQMQPTIEDGTKYPEVLQDNIAVTGLLYGDASFNKWMQSLTQLTNGNFYFNADYSPKIAQDVLISLVPDLEVVTLLQTTVILSDVDFHIYVDGTIGISTVFEVIFSNKGEFSITDPKGKEVTESTVEDADEGIWTISIIGNQGTAEVKVTTKSRPDVDQVEVVTWTSASSLGEVDLNEEGLIFYVSVTQGIKAVKGLDVTVTFYASDAGSSSLQVMLKDDGLGDPDTQLHDGIYSGYVTDFGSDAGARTSFFADVTIAPGGITATLSDIPSSDIPSPDIPSSDIPSSDIPSSDMPSSDIRKRNPNRYVQRHVPNTLPMDPFAEEPCCGSEAPDAIDLPLNRYSTGVTSVVVLNGPGDAPYDPPPSQVANVIITAIDQEGPEIMAGSVLVSLSWNAPGKDFTTGQVSDYEIWYSESAVDILEAYESCELIQDDDFEGGKPIPEDYGTVQEATIKLPKKVEESTSYYLIIVGVDGNQKGRPSPVLGVMIDAGEPYTTISTTAQSTTSTQVSTSDDTTTPQLSTSDGTTITQSSTSDGTPITQVSTSDGTTNTQSSTSEGTKTTQKATTQAAPTGITDKTTQKPKDFVGSPAFYGVVGGVGGVLLIVIIVAIFCYCKRKRGSKSSGSQMLTSKNIKTPRNFNDTSTYDSIRFSPSGDTNKKETSKDVEKGTPSKASVVEDPPPAYTDSKGVTNEAFENDSDDEDDLITTL